MIKMDYSKIHTICLNKNRGWRGLAEAKCFDSDGKEIIRMIFSFSQDVWDDMLKGYMVFQDQDRYIVVSFDNTEKLPKGQRSVLLKNFKAHVLSIEVYSKDSWIELSLKKSNYRYIANFLSNKNNHTKSDWNCIGIRVVPVI